MKNIAVMVSGHPKGFDLTFPYFQYWNKLYDNVKFDFFVSMWENDYNRKEVFDWTTAYEILDEKDCPYDLSKHENQRHQPHYSWALYRVNELRKKHQEIEYDAIIHTRGDSIFSRSLLNSLVNNLTKIRGGLVPEKDGDTYTGKSTIDTRPDPQISDKNILSANGSVIHNYFDPDRNSLNQNLWTQDVWFMGTPKVMDIFCNMFNYMFLRKDYMLHIMQAEYLNQMGIYNSPTEEGNTFTFMRDTYRFDFKTGDGGYPLEYPSPKQLKKLTEDKGLHWFYDDEKPKQRWQEVQDYFKETEK